MSEPLSTRSIYSTSPEAAGRNPEPPLGADPGPRPPASKEKPTPFLYRHPRQRILGGVCGGLADALGLDPSLVRILWVVLTIGTGGAGLLAYAALWLLLPVGTAAGGQQAPPKVALNERNVSRAGVLLVSIGGLWLLANLGVLPALWGAFWSLIRLLFWPVLLMGAGLLLLNNQQAWRGRFSRGGSQARTGFARGRDRAGSRLNRASLRQGFLRLRERIPLKRSREHRLIYGVCGGIGQAIGLDANLVRLLWAAFAIGSGGIGVLLYVLIGLLLPEEPLTIEARYTHAQDVPVIDGTVS